MSLADVAHRPPRRRTAAQEASAALRDVAGGELTRLPVTLRFWDGSELPAGAGAAGDESGAAGPDASTPTVTVTRPRGISHVLYEPGELGLSRAFVDGSVTSDDLESVLRLRRRVRAVRLDTRDRLRLVLAAVRAAGPAILRRPPIPAIEARVDGDRHSLRRDREAISHHYDVSNDFYRLVLGPTLVYSCAYFSDPADTLEQAQEAKLDLICRKLDLHPGERFLDIGCGWGSLVLHAAARYGVHATGITLSEPQAALARERAAALGIADRVTIRVADYRSLGGETFEKIASVGMYEHVGRGELSTYARAAAALLEPGGLMLNHGIAQLDDAPADPKTFIARYVFPDGELHPLSDLVAALQAERMEVRDVESLREHYPLTLRDWVANLRARRDEAEALVGAERTRTWDLYMIGSALAFEAGQIGVYQVLAARLDGPHGLPLDRRALLAERVPDVPGRGPANGNGVKSA